jgi:hypothetical protein
MILFQINEEHVGLIMEALSHRRAEVLDMGPVPGHVGRTRLSLTCPSRSVYNLSAWEHLFFGHIMNNGFFLWLYCPSAHYAFHCRYICICTNMSNLASSAPWNLDTFFLKFINFYPINSYFAKFIDFYPISSYFVLSVWNTPCLSFYVVCYNILT